IRFDRVLLESHAVPSAEALVQLGMARGLFRRDANGAVVYDTGRAEYAIMPLVRPDGFPTEHLRALALWWGLQQGAGPVNGCVHVMGDEWLTATMHWEAILTSLGH